MPETVPIRSEPTHSIWNSILEWRRGSGGWQKRRWVGCGNCHSPSQGVSLRKACRGCGCGHPPALGPPPARLSNTLGTTEHPEGHCLRGQEGRRERGRPGVTGLLSARALGQTSQPSSDAPRQPAHPGVLPLASRRLWFLLKKRSLCRDLLKTKTDQGGRNLCRKVH